MITTPSITEPIKPLTAPLPGVPRLSDGQRAARLQTAADKSKAMKQYEALRRSNMVVKAVVITELKDGSYHILGQNLTPTEMAPMVIFGARGFARLCSPRFSGS
jgi:hypothetical protein